MSLFLEREMTGVQAELIQPSVPWTSRPMHPESAMCPTDRGVYLALDGLVSWDAISESGNVAKRSSVPPGYVICQWSETGMR